MRQCSIFPGSTGLRSALELCSLLLSPLVGDSEGSWKENELNRRALNEEVQSLNENVAEMPPLKQKFVFAVCEESLEIIFAVFEEPPRERTFLSCAYSWLYIRACIHSRG